MPKTQKQFEEMRIATNSKIKNAAIRSFAIKGFAATNVQDIADSAGISIGLLYRHYKSKEDLYSELLAQASKALEDLAHIFQSNRSPSVLLNQVTQQILEETSVDDTFAQHFVLIEQSFKLEDKFPQIQQLLKNDMALINKTAEFIVKGQKSGQFIMGNAYQMAILYFSIIHGIINMKFILRDKFEMPDIKMITSFLLKEDYPEYL